MGITMRGATKRRAQNGLLLVLSMIDVSWDPSEMRETRRVVAGRDSA